jgi:hypothetical protein
MSDPTYPKVEQTAEGVIQSTNVEDLPDIPPYSLDVAASLISGVSSLNKFGRNVDVDTAAEEDIWSQGGLWVPPTTARVHAITGGAADVATTGTGAWTVEIQGLNGSFASTTETVSLNGATPVNTVNSYLIIHRMIVKTAGTGGKNAAAIVATAATDATVTASIDAGFNQTLMAIYQVAAGKSLYLSSYYASVNSTTAAKVDIFFWAKPLGEVWQIKHVQGIDSSGNGHIYQPFDPPLKFAEKTIIRMSCTTSANNTDVSAGFDGILK